MRVWDVPPAELCDNHLLGEHQELHAIWTILTDNRDGYRNHPEVKRWEGKLKALYHRHDKVVEEMRRRGFTEDSGLNKEKATGAAEQDTYVDSVEEQRRILQEKNCTCPRKVVGQ